MSELTPEEMSGETLDPHALPEDLPVTVIMRRYAVHATPWLDEKWQALAVLVPVDPAPEAALQPLSVEGMDDQLRYEGLRLRLHKDQCESYYYNMLSDQPRLFVMARPDDDGRPRPFHVSASFDEAGAGMEGDELVFPVAIPPQIYRWMEAYVLIHYVPQLKYKRKLTHAG
ncbi:DUF3305 domain-containing protein [Acidihalobacter prosperus]